MKFRYKYKLNNKGSVDSGFLVILEFNTNIYFQIRWIFYSYDFTFDSNRGAHLL